MPPSRWKVAALALAVLFLSHVLWDLMRSQGWLAPLPRYLRWSLEPAWGFLCCAVGLYVAHRTRGRAVLAELGLLGSIAKGLGFGLLATTPMLVYAVVFGKLAAAIRPVELLFFAGIWPLGEELIYRGYAFRQLHRRAGWNLWIAAVAVGATFGAAHLTNASLQRMALLEQAATVAVIAVGGVLFAWVFARWNDNLWAPLGLHGFMNLWWELFDLADSPLGGWGANAARLMTGVAAILLTRRPPRWLTRRAPSNP